MTKILFNQKKNQHVKKKLLAQHNELVIFCYRGPKDALSTKKYNNLGKEPFPTKEPKINSFEEKYFLESVNYCQNLKSFKLVDNSEYEEKSKALFFSNLLFILKSKDIYALDLRKCISSSDYSPKVLQNLTNMTSLKILKIDFALSYHDLTLLCKSLHNLEELSINFSSFKEKSLFIPPILLTLKKLKALQIWLTVREKNNYESRLIHSLLKRLYFSGVVIEFKKYDPTSGYPHFVSNRDLLLS